MRLRAGFIWELFAVTHITLKADIKKPPVKRG
jgi:hypothetical protein